MDVTSTSVLFNGRVPITVKQPALPASPDQQQQRHQQQQLQQRLPQLGGPAAVPVDNLFQGPPGPRHVQQRKHGITVRIALASRQGGRSKVLEVQLTDETDPFFLYQLDIGEEDFHRLKNDQNLLVDFQAFPEKFIELLNHCVRHRNEDHPKFVAQLTSEPSARCAVLNVIETNTFKHIAHLSLDFIPGDDARVKQYLANLVKDYKAEVSSLQQKLESSVAALTRRLQEQESHAAALATELETLRASSTEGSSRLQIQHAEEMARVRENAARELENCRRDAEKETRRLEMEYEDKLRNLSQKHSTVSATHNHLLSHSQTLEGALAAANKQLDAITHECQAFRQDFDRANARAEQLEAQRAEQEREIERLRGDLRETERRERERQAECNRLNDLVENSGDQKAKLEDSLNLYKTQNARLEETMRKATEEISKGNEIIQRLQVELRSCKSKIKLKNMVTLQQEKLLDERAHTLETQQKEIAGLQEVAAKRGEELEAARKRVDELQKRLDDSKRVIEENTNVIEWLHKQLNEDPLHRQPGAIGGLAGSPGFAHIDFDRYASVGGEAFREPRYLFAGGRDFRKSAATGGGPAYRSRMDVADAYNNQPLSYRSSIKQTGMHHQPPTSSSALASPPHASAANGRRSPTEGYANGGVRAENAKVSPSNAAETSHLNHSGGMQRVSSPAAQMQQHQQQLRQPRSASGPAGTTLAGGPGVKYQLPAKATATAGVGGPVKSNYF